MILKLLPEMKKSILITVICIAVSGLKAQTENPVITKLFEDSYHVFELMRNEKGMYRDSKLLKNNNDYHPASVANVGVGLVSLCIADAMGWDSEAAEKAIVTLKSVNGHTPGFAPDRTSNGYFRHFIDMNTGEQAWSSEYSTIDTDILMIGAIFCKNYFSNNSTISVLVDELWDSIDFTAAINDPVSGKIYLTMNADGSGGTNKTLPYNEYMLVAWLAKNDFKNNTTQAQQLWNNWYQNPANLPKSTYSGIQVLTDDHGEKRFLSSFIHLFNYYYISYFSDSNDYMQFFTNSVLAEKAYWQNSTGEDYEWGCGAGIDVDGYTANKINNNPNWTVSPHIIAGYLPIQASAEDDLLDLINNSKGVYDLPDNSSSQILWRYSLSNTSWTPNSVQGIDFSTMLYGLACLPEYLGNDFFTTYNRLDYATSVEGANLTNDISVRILPNPAIGGKCIVKHNGFFNPSIYVYTLSGTLIDSFKSQEGQTELDLNSYYEPVYLIKVADEKHHRVEKLLVNTSW